MISLLLAALLAQAPVYVQNPKRPTQAVFGTTLDGGTGLQVTCDNCAASGSSRVTTDEYSAYDGGYRYVYAHVLFDGGPVSAAIINRVITDVFDTYDGGYRNVYAYIQFDGGIVSASIVNNVTIGVFPDNEPFNVAQINGVAPLMGNGASGTGAQRVTLADNSTGILASIGAISTSVTPGTGAANLGKAEDGAHTSADVGVMALAVRKDTNATLTSADSEYVALAADNYGVLSVSERHPNAIRCTITSTATTSTVVTGCSAPGAGLSIYLTSINWSTSIISTTANFMRLQYGTGGTCGTGTTVIYDGYASAAFGNLSWSLETPIKIAANNEVCFVHASAGTRLVNLTGFIAP